MLESQFERQNRVNEWDDEGISRPVCPENLKLFINLTFFDFLLMLLDQRTLPSSDMSW
jgi:hypothetical protein